MGKRNVDGPINGTGGDQKSSSRSQTFRRSRRQFLTSVAAVGMASVAPAGKLFARTTASSTKRSLIDVHHHIVPPFYLAENRDRIVAAGGGRINSRTRTGLRSNRSQPWKDGVVRLLFYLSVLHLVWIPTAARTARRVNEYATDLGEVTQSASASLHHPPSGQRDRQREIEYAYSTKADGPDW